MYIYIYSALVYKMENLDIAFSSSQSDKTDVLQRKTEAEKHRS